MNQWSKPEEAQIEWGRLDSNPWWVLAATGEVRTQSGQGKTAQSQKQGGNNKGADTGAGTANSGREDGNRSSVDVLVAMLR